MDRRTFAKLMFGAIAAAYVPAKVTDTIIKVTEPLPAGKTKKFIITRAEFVRLPDRFADMFRLVGYPEDNRSHQVYAAVMIDDYTLYNSRPGKNSMVKMMLENMERQIQDYLKDSSYQIVYNDKLHKAMTDKGVRL
jgi:hypothetical protein